MHRKTVHESHSFKATRTPCGAVLTGGLRTFVRNYSLKHGEYTITYIKKQGLFWLFSKISQQVHILLREQHLPGQLPLLRGEQLPAPAANPVTRHG